VEQRHTRVLLPRPLASQSEDTPPAAFVWLLQLSVETMERMGRLLHTNYLTITRFSYKKIAHSFSYITAPALQNTTPKKAGPAFGAFFS
jgi:hypothetical protein